MFDDKLVLGIVGKIGSGKSTVARIFSEQYDFTLIDVDKLGHQALLREQDTIVNHFGTGILDEKGVINRALLGNLVFADIHKLHTLNNIVHPIMKQDILQFIESSAKRRFLIDAALLFEMGLDELCDFVLSIDAPVADIIHRVCTNRKWPETKVKQVLEAQKYLDLLKDKSHFIIFNNSDIEKLKKQIEFFMLEIT